jgi:ADP-heptose:LPS heptosyltransferase
MIKLTLPVPPTQAPAAPAATIQPADVLRPGGKPVNRVAVLRALQLGDLLVAVPALRALRAALPNAHITLVGLPWASEFVRRFHGYVDDLLVLPGWPGLPERPAEPHRVAEFLAGAQSAGFDLAVQMHGSGGVTNQIVSLLGAKRTAGYHLPGAWRPDAETFLAYPDGEPEVRRHLRLMAFLGAPPKGEHLEFPVTPDDFRALSAVDEVGALAGQSYACLHPGARDPAGRWPTERFAAVGDALSARGLKVVLTGSAEEADLTAAVAAAMEHPAVDLAGVTDLGTLAALLSGAELLVCNDTGVSHVADALGVASVVLFGASDPNRWAPLDRRRHRPVERSMQAVPETVIAEIDTLLSEQTSYAAG